MSKETHSELTPVHQPHPLVTVAEKELEPQGKRAISGMIEVLKFYALASVLKADAEAREGLKSHGEIKIGKGRPSKESDLKAIFEKHAPGLNLKSAHRLYDVGLSIADSYEEIVGVKVAKQIDLPTLVSTEPAKLPEPIRKKQQELFSYVTGTSQKSWLDKLRPPKPSGGNKYERGNGKGARKKLTHAQAMELLRAVTVNAMEHLRFLHDKHAYVAVSDEAELDGLLNHLEETTKDVRAWKQMNQAERSAALAERVKLQIKEGQE